MLQLVNLELAVKEVNIGNANVICKEQSIVIAKPFPIKMDLDPNYPVTLVDNFLIFNSKFVECVLAKIGISH